MYAVRTPSYSKSDPVMRWALPDRVFFACGACHILAHAFLERYGDPNASVRWIKPVTGFTGSHIYVSGDSWVFDYHGYSETKQYLSHTWKVARRRWPGWDAEIVDLPRQVLVSEAQSRTFPGLWLREPKQFLHDAHPRAVRYLERFPPPPEPDRSDAA
ncbi:hypothetical protein [Marinivivus vitaminiproducens]|uniref:hypothetical protein n=1 Tax=Marinivivus vitaminiproducens TaxID=3035935 RepID=UPI00279FC07E|nr:hypothetical protein P4R82_23930 [Geminicoccaceae bacterium SCSIO 64248]